MKPRDKVKVDEKIVTEIMEDINESQLSLPHFQRDFDWKPEKQKSLIASFLYNIPIGSMLFLETETDMITKKIGYKNSEHNSIPIHKEISYLMDGQQRLTTLKGVFDDFFKHNPDEMFKKLYSNLKYRWFLKLNLFNKDNIIDESNTKVILDLIKKGEISDDRSLSDIEDLITHKEIYKTKQQQDYHPHILKNEPSSFSGFLQKNQYLALFLLLPSIEKGTELSIEYENLLKEPTQKIFEDKWFKAIKKNTEEKRKFDSILRDYNISVDLNNNEEITNISNHWSKELYDSLRHFLTERRKLITITYKDFSKAVVAFTAMNTGGLRLSTFDIIVAKYAALPNKKLLKNRIEEQFKKTCEEKIEMLPNIEIKKIFNHFLKDKGSETQNFYRLYLNMLGIFSSKKGVTLECIKEKTKLSLTKNDIDKNTDKAVTSLALAFKFLAGYCGVSKIDKISYQLMILPIAKNLYEKYNKNVALKQKDIFKILYWYWHSIFGGRYREKQPQRSIEDIGIISTLLNADDAITQSESKIISKIFDDVGYSDFNSLNQRETNALENPVLQFVFAYSVLNKNLTNYSEVVNKLQNVDLEESHLISLDDYNKKMNLTDNKKIKRNQKHYINSVFNLALLPKEKNNSYKNKSWCDWNQDALRKEKICMPEKINELNWDKFSKKMKNSTSEEMEKLCMNFLENRYEEIKNTVEKRLNHLSKNFITKVK